MILVADSSALIALASCESLGLLEALYGQVVVPQAVYDECTQDGKPFSTELTRFLAQKIQSIDLTQFVLLDGLADVGEMQAMILYKQSSADLLLIDDKRARRIAELNQINTIGSMRVLLEGKKAGLIPSLKPLLNQIAASPVFITSSLIATVLDLANE